MDAQNMLAVAALVTAIGGGLMVFRSAHTGIVRELAGLSATVRLQGQRMDRFEELLQQLLQRGH